MTPEPPVSGTTNIESSVEGKPIRRAAAKLLLLDSNQDQRFQRPVCCRYTKEECARTHRTRMPDCVPPCRSNPFLLTGFQALSRGLSLQIGWRMVRESNSPGTSAPTVLAGLRLCRTAHHPCQCFQYGAHRPNLDKPLMGTIFMRGSRSREDSNLRGLAPLLLSGQSHSTALPPLHRSTRRNKPVGVFVRISCSRWDSNPRP